MRGGSTFRGNSPDPLLSPYGRSTTFLGEPGHHVLLTNSPPGVIALFPLLEKSMEQVASELEVTGSAGHALDFEHVLERAIAGWSPHWAELAVAWLEAGFPRNP